MTADGARVKEVIDLLLRERDLPSLFFVGGSGGLALRGLRPALDLDIGVSTRDWFALARSPLWEVITPDPLDYRRRCDPPIARTRVIPSGDDVAMTVDAWSSWRWRGFHETEFNDFNLVFREGIEFVEGVPCLKLVHLLRMKVDAVQNGFDGGTVRPKDVHDLQLISTYLGLSL